MTGPTRSPAKLAATCAARATDSTLPGIVPPDDGMRRDLPEACIVVSPHAAAPTDDSLLVMGMMTVKNALTALDGTLDPALVVNRDVLNGGTHAP